MQYLTILTFLYSQNFTSDHNQGSFHKIQDIKCEPMGVNYIHLIEWIVGSTVDTRRVELVRVECLKPDIIQLWGNFPQHIYTDDVVALEM